MPRLGAREKAKLLRKHVRLLGSFHGIRVIRHYQGKALKETRTIWIRDVRSERTYAEAMHEMGHILGPWQSASELARECGAWIWARRNALNWTPPMDERLIQCLGSYIDYASKSDLPNVGHPAWKILRAAGAIPPRTHREKR